MTFDELEKCLIEEFGDSDTNDLADLVWIARGESAGLCGLWSRTRRQTIQM